MWQTTQFPPLQATEKKIKLLKISHHHLFTVKPIAPFRGAQKEREGMLYLGICHRCEGRQKKSIPSVTVEHQKACQVMPDCDLEGRIYLSHTKDSFSCILLISERGL